MNAIGGRDEIQQFPEPRYDHNFARERRLFAWIPALASKRGTGAAIGAQ
jgi:hypothetical protein